MVIKYILCSLDFGGFVLFFSTLSFSIIEFSRYIASFSVTAGAFATLN